MDLSIIIPTYNAEKSLEKCLDSIFNQVGCSYEVIIVDDGSSDNSYSILQMYQERYSNCIIYKQSNKGVSAARNKGISLASGKYLMFVDSDDILDKEMVEALNLKESMLEAQIILTGYKQVNLKDMSQSENYPKRRGLISIDDFLNLEFQSFFERWLLHSPWAKVYSLKIIKEKSIYFNENYSLFEDIDFVIRYLKEVQNIYVIDDVKYNYLVRDSGSLVTKFNYNTFEALMTLSNNMKILLDTTIQDNINFYQRYIGRAVLKYCQDLYRQNVFSKKKKIYRLNEIFNNLQFIEIINNIKFNHYFTDFQLHLIRTKKLRRYVVYVWVNTRLKKIGEYLK